MKNKNCKFCNKNFLPIRSNVNFCSRKCAYTYHNRTEEKKRINKIYAQSERGKYFASLRTKKRWQNIKLARKLKKLKLKKKKLTYQQKQHLKKFEKEIDRINRNQRNYRKNPDVKRRKRLSHLKYYAKEEVRKKRSEYSKRYSKTEKGRLSRLYRTIKRRSARLNANVAWTDHERIKEIYKNCPKGYHVDHIIPLQSKIVCGLHVENNLQYLTAKENISKGNRFIND